MARPDTTLASVDSQLGGWDSTVDNNGDKLRSLLFLEPYPIPLVHRVTADEGSTLITDFAAADYKWCLVLVVDPVSAATSGRIAYSDGTDWRYQKTDAIV